MKALAVLPLLLVAISFVGCGGGGGGGGSSDIDPPVITNAQVSPTLVVRGGIVHWSATVSDNVGVSSVRLLAQGTAAESQLSASGAGTYSGTLVFPTTTVGGVYQVVVEATDAAGNVSQSTALNVTVESPPQPPSTASG